MYYRTDIFTESSVKTIVRDVGNHVETNIKDNGLKVNNWTKLDGREVTSNAGKSSLKSGIISASTTVVSETFNTFKKGKGLPLSKNIKSSLKPNNIKERWMGYFKLSRNIT